MFFAYKYVTQSVNIFACKNVTESASFFGYKNVTEGALVIVYKNAPSPSTNFKNLMKNRVTQRDRIFVYKKREANYLAFFEVSQFLYTKTSHKAKWYSFCINI